MSLKYGFHDGGSDDLNTDNLCCVKVNVGTTPETNDLVSSLAADLTPSYTQSIRQVIFEPSEVIAFQLNRSAQPPSYDASMGWRTERETFKYPKSIYLDQFMRESYELADAKRQEQKKLMAEVKELEERKKNLLFFNVRVFAFAPLSRLMGAGCRTRTRSRTCSPHCTTMSTSRRATTTPSARTSFARTGTRSLRSSRRSKRRQNVRYTSASSRSPCLPPGTAIDANITRMQAEAQGLLDCPELQKHRVRPYASRTPTSPEPLLQYDLRVVLVHDGLFGRSHLYSYVKQNGKWWKTVDYQVTEV